MVRHSGLDWTIFRPSLIYGYDDRDRLLNLLKQALSPPLDIILLHSFPLLDGGRPLIQPVSVREVARCFAHAPAKAMSIGCTYDLVGPVAFTWRDMVGKVAGTLGKKAIYEEVPLLLFLRMCLWLTAMIMPLLVIASFAANKLSLFEAGMGAVVAILVVILARRSRPVILFNIPAEPMQVVAELFSALAPRSLQMSEQLKMAVENNTGDPWPAAKTFGYVPESFEQGVSRIIRPKSIS